MLQQHHYWEVELGLLDPNSLIFSPNQRMYPWDSVILFQLIENKIQNTMTTIHVIRDNFQVDILFWLTCKSLMFPSDCEHACSILCLHLCAIKWWSCIVYVQCKWSYCGMSVWNTWQVLIGTWVTQVFLNTLYYV